MFVHIPGQLGLLEHLQTPYLTQKVVISIYLEEKHLQEHQHITLLLVVCFHLHLDWDTKHVDMVQKDSTHD